MQIIKYFLLIVFYSLVLPSYLFAINHPPVFTPPLTRGVAVGDTLIFMLIASDPDGDALTWSAENLPPGALFNSSTQTFFWILGNAGTFKVTFAVDDGHGHLVRQKITIRAANRGEWFTVSAGDFPTVRLNKVFFVNDSTGWAIGENGVIVNTKDGGTTWQILSSKADRSLSDLYFVDEKRGWIIGEDAVSGKEGFFELIVGFNSDEGIILHTNDGGITWDNQISGHVVGLDNVQFVDSTTGWINTGYSILSTLDGGKAWKKTPSPSQYLIKKFYFINSDTGWSVTRYGKIFQTEDGGLTWNLQFSTNETDFYDIQFIDSMKGWTVGDNGNILFTKDGGKTWENQNSGVSWDILQVQFIDDKTGWANGPFNIVHTIDGGITWENRWNGNIYIKGLHFINSTNGVMVGSLGSIFKTTDGGKTWSSQVEKLSIFLRGVNFTDRKNGWVVVNGGGMVLHSNDGGANWGQISLVNGMVAPYGFQFADSLNGWITYSIITSISWDINSGGIYHTSDGGKTWVNQNVPLNKIYWDVHFLNPDTGFALGHKVLVHTVDGGKTWNIQYRWGTELYALYFINNRRGWVVGSSGMMYETSDGGITWNALNPQNMNLNGVFFVDTMNGWAVGNRGTIISTTDGGKTWVKQNSWITQGLGKVYFVDVLTGWAIGNEGVILYTEDGGYTWTSQFSGTTGQLWDIYFSDPTTGWIVGDYGTILKIRRNAFPATGFSLYNGMLPTTFALYQNFPNPFNPVTTVRCQIPKASQVTVKVYNLLGQEVKTLLNKNVLAGNYEILWDGTNNHGNKVASGIYLYRMETSTGFVQTRKMVFLK